MRKLIDLTGKKFGRLTVLERSSDKIMPNGAKKPYWVCQCDCGVKTIVSGSSLRCGYTKSCGCLNKELFIKRSTKHNKRYNRIYKTWKNMKQRCNYVKDTHYKDYGGRGIKVCKEWEDDFESFYNWAMNNGYNDTLTIDRINVDGNYEPNNCRWIAIEKQAINRRNTIKYDYNGCSLTIKDISLITGIKEPTIRERLKRGWSIDRIINTPVAKNYKLKEVIHG